MSDERAAEGVEHLQRAGHELIAAARAFLDVAEEVVADREAVAEVVSFVGSVAGAATEAAASAGLGGRPARTEPDDPTSHVEHIDVT